jgi:hypothetical protein
MCSEDMPEHKASATALYPHPSISERTEGTSCFTASNIDEGLSATGSVIIGAGRVGHNFSSPMYTADPTIPTVSPRRFGSLGVSISYYDWTPHWSAQSRRVYVHAQ